MFKNLITFAASALVSLLLAEGVMRLVFDPLDYLAVETVPDPVLNHRIESGANGHDDWGYRNAGVPNAADVLAIGDSMTYGVMAKSFEAWPAQMENITGKSVYSAALGGYGPLHYLSILKTRAPKLSPSQVVVMIYPGNDLLDTYNLAYSNEHWSDYRQSDADLLNPALFLPQREQRSMVKQLRSWLAHNSVLYRVVTQIPLFDNVRQQELLERPGTISYEHLGATVVLEPAKRLNFANYEDPRIREALDIVARVLTEMANYCAENGISLHVAIMPVREHVFHGIAKGLPDPEREAIRMLSDNLEAIEAELTASLDAAGIAYTNLREPMEQALKLNNIYPPTDGHPNAAG